MSFHRRNTLGLPLVAEHRERRGRQREQTARRRLKVEPPGAEDSEEMPMGEQQHVSVGLDCTGDDLCPRARPTLGGGLAARDAVGPERPAGPFDADVDGAAALVVPVVPLEEVVGGLTSIAEPGEPAGLAGPRERARQDERKGAPSEPAARELGLRTTLLGEGDVGASGVSPEPRPLGLAVTHENDLVLGHDRSLPRARGRLLPMRMRRLPRAWSRVRDRLRCRTVAIAVHGRAPLSRAASRSTRPSGLGRHDDHGSHRPVDSAFATASNCHGLVLHVRRRRASRSQHDGNTAGPDAPGEPCRFR